MLSSQPQRYGRNRNITYENLAGDLEKQKKKEKLISWRDRSIVKFLRVWIVDELVEMFREMFVDTSRAVNVTMGETDNKKALDQRKKQLMKEKRKYGLADPDEEANKLSWEMFYDKV